MLISPFRITPKRSLCAPSQVSLRLLGRTFLKRLRRAPMKVAIYARYSSDLQRPTSLEDQIRKCRQFAEQRGWNVVEEFVRSDAEVSGSSLANREALDSLVSDDRKRPRSFNCLMIDDTSRLGRNLTDVLKISDILKYNEVS